MKPEYVNTFGLRKVSDKQGEILEDRKSVV